jgi:hypothetical protein
MGTGMDKIAPLHLRPWKNDENALHSSSSSRTLFFSSLSPLISFLFSSSLSSSADRVFLLLHFILVRPLPFFLQH